MLEASEYLSVDWIMLRIWIFWVVMLSIRVVDSRRFEGSCRLTLEGFFAEIFYGCLNFEGATVPA
jgi:hypothetical protein